jgi:hypothetical protein
VPFFTPSPTPVKFDSQTSILLIGLLMYRY